jgi:hypothetical protein
MLTRESPLNFMQGEEEAKRAAQQHISGLFLVEKAS